jgi:Rrf2 family protein
MLAEEAGKDMSKVLKISDAASLALHTAVLLADRTDGPLTTKEIAATFGVSECTLAKVLQRLAKAGIVLSGRGPKGGFLLGKRADQTTLLEVYEAIEGPLGDSHCLLGAPVCGPFGVAQGRREHGRIGGGHNCILGRLVNSLNVQVREYFSNTRLSDATSAFKNLALYDRIMGTRVPRKVQRRLPFSAPRHKGPATASFPRVRGIPRTMRKRESRILAAEQNGGSGFPLSRE